LEGNYFGGDGDFGEGCVSLDFFNCWNRATSSFESESSPKRW
jgi:hypothetical protein